MGRRKIEILPILNKRNRNGTFQKRRAGLLKKAYELGVLCSVDIQVIIIEKDKSTGHDVKLHVYSSQTDLGAIPHRMLNFNGQKEVLLAEDFIEPFDESPVASQDEGGNEHRDDSTMDDGINSEARPMLQLKVCTPSYPQSYGTRSVSEDIGHSVPLYDSPRLPPLRYDSSPSPSTSSSHYGQYARAPERKSTAKRRDYENYHPYRKQATSTSPQSHGGFLELHEPGHSHQHSKGADSPYDRDGDDFPPTLTQSPSSTPCSECCRTPSPNPRRHPPRLEFLCRDGWQSDLRRGYKKSLVDEGVS